MAPDPEPPLRNAGDDLEVIVAGIDMSNGASRVVSVAARVARSYPAAALHVVHVFRTGRFDRAHAGGSAINADALQEGKEHLESHVRAARSQCRNQVTGHFSIGDPTAEVLRVSKELAADLLVVGTHDHVGFERLLLGSIAETLMRKAGCSVLIVRPTKH